MSDRLAETLHGRIRSWTMIASVVFAISLLWLLQGPVATTGEEAGAVYLAAESVGSSGTAESPGPIGSAVSNPTPAPSPLSGDPAAVPSEWFASVTAMIAASEYEVSESEQGLQAPNRRQNLRTYFRAGGPEVIPRTSTEPSWVWRWRTTGWGRSGGITELPPQNPSPDCYRVTYEHTGLVEWYENGPTGLEQGFTIADAPPGDGFVCVEGTISGGLIGRLLDGDTEVEFLDSEQQLAFHYGDLVAYDASGRELPAWLETEEDRIRIVVDDTDATYPCVIDPILTTPSWTKSATQTGAQLGYSVSTAGDVNGDGFSDIIIAANGYDHGETNEGRVYVYHGSPDGLEDDAAWDAESNQYRAFLGTHVSTAGDVNGDGYDDVLAVAWEYDFDYTAEGVAWLWMGSPDGLEESPSWERLGGQTGAQLAIATTAGDVNADGYSDVIVACPSYTETHTSEGMVWAFLGSASGLETSPTWSARGQQTSAFFGVCIAPAGDVNGNGYDDIIIGSHLYDAGEVDEGRAFVYYGSPVGLNNTPAWSRQSNQAGAHYADCVATAGDVNGDGYADIIVGAHLWEDGEYREGRAELFLGSDLGPSPLPDWAIDGDADDAWFGYQVSTAGDVNGDGYADVLVNELRYRTDVDVDLGEVHLYLGSWSGLATVPVWTVDGDANNIKFGSALSTAGDVNGDGFSDILIGASNYSPSLDLGRVYVYHGAPDGPKSTAGWVTESNQINASYGISLAYAGDVNADGRTDVLVGASSYDNGETDEGAVFLFLGSGQGLEPLPVWYAEGNQAGAQLGRSVASAGDVNGDGLEDVIVGAPRYDGSFTDEGAAFVWMSAPGGIPFGNPANAHWTKLGGQAGAQCGWSVSSAGNVNGDEYADILVGAYLYDNGHDNEGAVWAFHGSPSGPSTTSDWFRDSGQAFAYYGVSVAHAGDFNGDGYSDVIVGASRYAHPESLEGLAFLYTGSADGLSLGAPYWYGESNQASAWFGSCVAGAGDVNGDGYSDILVGAPYYDNPTSDGGTAYLWYGTPVAPDPGNPDNADWSSGRQQADASYGYSVSSAGDVDGDGYSDLIVGCPDHDNSAGSDAGMVALWYGSPDGPYPTAAGWLVEGSQSAGNFGWVVAGSGDVNGDGFCDVLVGAHDYTNGQSEEGRSFLFYGNDSRGLSRNPRQANSTLVGLVAPLGRSNSETAFGLGLRGRTAGGRDEVRMEWEVKPYGTPFDGTGLGSGPWTDSGEPTDPDGSFVDLAQAITGLDPGTGYHWRLRIGVRDPLFPRSPWLHLPYNGATEMDLRTAGTPSALEPLNPIAGTGTIGSQPNPFREGTTIHYSLDAAASVGLDVYDVQGKLVRRLVDVAQSAGVHHTRWNGSDDRGVPAPAGVYFLRLETPVESRTLRLVRIE